jgi:mannosyltransferase OCH1-like enzyme
MAKMLRFGLYRHVIGVLALFSVVLYLLRVPIRVLFQSRDEFTVDREWPPPTAPLADDDQQQQQQPPPRIPKVVHQVYNMWSDGPIPHDWEMDRKSCMDLNPDYKFELWDKDSARELIATKYAWFLETFDNYRYPIQRADSIRYFILLEYGGIYLDMDVGCARNLDPLLKYPAFMSAAPTIGVTNSIMGAMPGHPYFAQMVDSLISYDINWVLPYLTIMNTAGTHYVSFQWSEYLLSQKDDHDGDNDDDDDDDEGLKDNNKVYVLMPAERSRQPWSFFKKGRGGSWHNWDNKLFHVADLHPYLAASMCVPLVALLCSIPSWCVWLVLLAARRNRIAAWHKQLYLD